jgi:hypothetical protein
MPEAAPMAGRVDFPIGELQVLDDRVRDHVAFGISQRSARAANLEGHGVSDKLAALLAPIEIAVISATCDAGTIDRRNG